MYFIDVYISLQIKVTITKRKETRNTDSNKKKNIVTNNTTHKENTNTH